MSILITGGDGYVGSKVARKFLDQTSENLILWVRSKNEDEKRAKMDRIQSGLSQGEWNRVQVVASDLRSDGCFDMIDTSQVTQILHTAAVIRFNVEEELANEVNVQGTKRALEFASCCENLKSFDYLSTVYTSGKKDGAIPETLFEGESGFVNHYERSKNAAEKMMEAEFKAVPWQIIRIATIIADNEQGDVVQFNVFHNTMRLLYNGLISLLPGDKDTPLYLITGEFAAQSTFELMRNPIDKSIYHVCHTQEESATLEDLMTWLFETFSEQDNFVKMKILRPLFADEKTFDILATNMKSLSAGIVSDALSSITPFASQLYIKKSFEIDNAKKQLVNYKAPNPKELIKNTARSLIRTRWGKNA